jgi:dipeptidyl-peptidase-4
MWILIACVLITPNQSSAEDPNGKKPDGPRFDPVVKEIEGWEIHVEPALLTGEHREEGALALKMLANHLQRIKILVPKDRLVKLQKVAFWIEHAHPKLRGKQYHPGKKWLTDRGYDARLAKKVHITHAAELFSRQQLLKHPAVVLHELAHGYHDQVLGFNEPRIKAAYAKAMKAGNYESVQSYNGRMVRHYGATNHNEYFAEATEAYFYRNDFFPFVRAELKRHDPTIHDLLVDIWGPAK